MVRRLISANASEILNMSKDELKQSIKASDGRVILSENVVLHEPIVHDITATELSKAFGADMILLNAYNVNRPIIAGLNDELYWDMKPDFESIHKLRKLVGLPIGLNLEPVDESAKMNEERDQIPIGRQAVAESFKKANEQGFQFVCITGNPGVGVSNNTIETSIKVAKENFDGLIIAGKMHSAGVDEKVVDLNIAKRFIEAGADIILVPAVGTVPGILEKDIIDIVGLAHQHDVLVMSAIGTSQESSHPDTIRDIGLLNKKLGVDIHHIGDANMGLVGVRNIEVLSDAIRGARHTVSRFARSVNR